ASGAADELTDLRDAAFAAAGSLPGRWIAVGRGPADSVGGPRQTGTFAGYGVDVPIALSPGHGDAPTELPLSALVTGWLRSQVNPDAYAEVRVYSDVYGADAARERGRRLHAEIDDTAGHIGVLVVADGA